jgi:hypothetical protein
MRPAQKVPDPEPQTLKGRRQTGGNNGTPEQEKGRKQGIWKRKE